MVVQSQQNANPGIQVEAEYVNAPPISSQQSAIHHEQDQKQNDQLFLSENLKLDLSKLNEQGKNQAHDVYKDNAGHLDNDQTAYSPEMALSVDKKVKKAQSKQTINKLLVPDTMSRDSSVCNRLSGDSGETKQTRNLAK